MPRPTLPQHPHRMKMVLSERLTVLHGVCTDGPGRLSLLVWELALCMFRKTETLVPMLIPMQICDDERSKGKVTNVEDD